jgi:protein TonB
VTPLDGNPGRYFTAQSYPSEALAAHVYGRVIALLNINAAGTVEQCRIVSSAGTALNNGTCKVAMRIRFKPPRDKEGVALPSTYVLPVRWTMPGAPDNR